MELLTILLIVLVTFISAIVGGMIGGGFLILIPFLVFIGWDIHQVIGISKVLGIAICLCSFNFIKNNKTDFKSVWPYMILTSIGSIIGSIVMISINASLAQTIIAILMVFIALFILLNEKYDLAKNITLGKKYMILSAILIILIGFYDGFFGAGSTIMMIMVFAVFMKKDYVSSLGSSHLIFFVSGTVSFLIFAYQGLIDYSIAIPLGIISVIGAWIGSNITLKRGNTFARYALVSVSILCAIKLLVFR